MCFGQRPPQADPFSGSEQVGSVRSADFQDRNFNGIDDRDEGQQSPFQPTFQQPQRPFGGIADYSLGFGRQFQPSAFFNPYMGGYGYGSPYGGYGSPYGGYGGGFGYPYGGYNNMMGGIGGLYGGFNAMRYGGGYAPALPTAMPLPMPAPQILPNNGI